MVSETDLRAISKPSPAWWSGWPLALVVGVGLWAHVARQLLYDLPRTVHSVQNFGYRGSWYLWLFVRTPDWSFMIAAAVSLLGSLLSGRRRLLLLFGVPLAMAVAIHFSLHKTQRDLLWAIDRASIQRHAER